MTIYSAENLETLRTLKLLKYWRGDRLLTEQQGQQLQEETVSDLRTTNLFLRVVLFLFTVGILVLIQGLFITLLALSVSHGTDNGLVVLLLLSSAVCYAVAECAVREGRLFHFGIEEASVVCSIGFLFWGLQLHHAHFKAGSDLGELFLVAVCAGVSLWTWYRFGYWYTFVAAMLFVAFAALCLTKSAAAEHALVAIFYAVGLVGVTAAGTRHRSDHLHSVYSVAEALLWAGIYFSINLVPYGLIPRWFDGSGPTGPPVSPAFYWFTWILIWCLPPVLLVRGIRRKDRVLLVLGAVLVVVTFICNKPYLGWQRHPWDPMMLGIVLMGVAWSLQRWLALGTGGIRNGFTSARVAGTQSAWMDAGTATFSLISPHAMSHRPQSGGIETPHGEGGDSGGGGAGGTF